MSRKITTKQKPVAAAVAPRDPVADLSRTVEHTMFRLKEMASDANTLALATAKQITDAPAQGIEPWQEMVRVAEQMERRIIDARKAEHASQTLWILTKRSGRDGSLSFDKELFLALCDVQDECVKILTHNWLNGGSTSHFANAVAHAQREGTAQFLSSIKYMIDSIHDRQQAVDSLPTMEA